jgi:anaerobic magnesium-protoporphyrin IX monomethyl ester cyclase
MEKGTRVEQIYNATRLLKEKNIKVAFFIQIGYLGETKEDILKTVQMIKDLLPDDIGISVSYPLPGTKFYEIVRGDMKAKTNWSDSDDLAMMFKNTYPPIYYKRMHHYIHGVYRLVKVPAAPPGLPRRCTLLLLGLKRPDW